MSSFLSGLKKAEGDVLVPVGHPLVERFPVPLEDVEATRREISRTIIGILGVKPFYAHLAFLVQPILVHPFAGIALAAVNYEHMYFQAARRRTILKWMGEIAKDESIPPDTQNEVLAQLACSLSIADLAESQSKVPSCSVSTLPMIVYIHELLHLVFEHLIIPENFDRTLANISQDVVINRVLAQEFQDGIPGRPGFRRLAAATGLVRIEGDDLVVIGLSEKDVAEGKKVLIDPKFSSKESIYIEGVQNLDWLDIYWKLLKQRATGFLSGSGGGNGSEGSGSGGSGRGRSEEESKESEGATEKKSGGGKSGTAERKRILVPLSGDCDYGWVSKKDANLEANRMRVKSALIAAAEAFGTKNIGELPADIQRLIDAYVDPKVPWSIILRNLLQTIVLRDDYSWYPGNLRRLSSTGYVMPALKRNTYNPVVVAIDSSGSMSDEEIAIGLSEISALRSACKAKCCIIVCDAAVHHVHMFDEWDVVDPKRIKVTGGGGTSFVPVFEKISELCRAGYLETPSALIYFTDTLGEFPDEKPEYPVIWVTSYKSAEVPWGELVFVDNGA